MGAQHSKRFHGTLQSSPAIRRTRSRSNSQHNDGSLRLMVVADYVRLSPPCTFCTHRSRSRHRDPQRVRYVYRPHSYPAQVAPLLLIHSLASLVTGLSLTPPSPSPGEEGHIITSPPVMYLLLGILVSPLTPRSPFLHIQANVTMPLIAEMWRTVRLQHR